MRGDDYLDVRAAPSVRAPVVGRVTTEDITIAETRGRGSRITAPVAGWAWDESIGRDCH